MSSTLQEPTQAERLEDVAVAGPGADDREKSGDRLPEHIPNGSAETHSDQSDEVVDPKVKAGEEMKPPQAPQRSKGKVALIMGSLMVSIPRLTSWNPSIAKRYTLDRCVSCSSRYCESCLSHPRLFPLTRLN